MSATAWLVLPTYNEADNLAGIVAAAQSALRSSEAVDEHAILVVDDGSPDGTGVIADRLAAVHPDVHVLHRPGKSGLGRAYVAGFAYALERGADYVLEMDSDFSHDPAELPRLLALTRDGSDVVLGSRYIRGGGIDNWSIIRRIVSRCACIYTRLVLRIPVRDGTGGFKCFRSDALRAIDYTSVRAEGYAFQVELTYRALRQGLRVTESPIIFYERREGHSKMSRAIAVEAVWRIPQLRLDRSVG